MGAIRSALFVDYDNAQGLVKGANLSGRLPNWISWLEDGAFDPKRRKRKFLVKSTYWHPTHRHVAPVFEHAGFLTRECIYVAGSKKDMSAVDLYLAIDVMDAVTRMGNIQEVVILATDSDYFPLIATLRARNVRTAIIVSHKASEIYEAEADIPIPVSSLADAYDYVRPRRRDLMGIFPFASATSAIPQPPGRAAAVASRVTAPTPESPTQVTSAVADFDTVARSLADFVCTKKRPIRAPEVIAALRALAPDLRTSGPNAFLGRESLVSFLTEVAKTTGRVKVFWMGPGQLAVRATRS